MITWCERAEDVAVVEDRTTPVGGPAFWYAVKPAGRPADYLHGFRETAEEAIKRVHELLRDTRGVEPRGEGPQRKVVAIEGWKMDPEIRAELRAMFR